MGSLWGRYGDVRPLGGMWAVIGPFGGIKGDGREVIGGIWGCCGGTEPLWGQWGGY